MSEASQYQIAEEQNNIYQKNRSHAHLTKEMEYSLGKKWNYQYAKMNIDKGCGKGRGRGGV